MLREMCCKFWGLQEKMVEYSLYDHNFAHLMALNSDKNHMQHRVSDYFKYLKRRHP